MTETADDAADRIINAYIERMILGNARGDMSWVADLRADVTAAIRSAVAPFDPDGDGRPGGSRKRRERKTGD